MPEPQRKHCAALVSCVVAILFAIAVSFAGVASAQTYLASSRIGTAALLTPTAADAFYGASTTSTNDLGVDRPTTELAELVRALHNDPDRIYDYVRNNIETVWMYGLQKGALGALLDHSGTPFDQAKLMVDLLRRAGYAASYQAGTITLSGSQFADWTQITSASAACQLLSSGAIPAIINGSTLSGCSYGAATVSTITLSHIWVAVIIGGTTYVFDPSYKSHDFVTGFNLNTATGLTAGQALSNATTGMTSGTSSSVNYVRGLNATSLNSTLQTYSGNLLSYIQTNLPAAEIEQVVGGQHIHRYDAPAGGLRQTSLPYTASVQRSWSGDIPDQYRTTLRVQISKEMVDESTSQVTLVQIIDRTLFVDEIYGRKLIVESSIPGPNLDNFGRTALTVNLRLTDHAGAGPTVATYFKANEIGAYRTGVITLSANHPYASSASGGTSTTGDYMDASVTKNVYMYLTLTIVHGWGDAGRGLVESWGTRIDHSLLPFIQESGEPEVSSYQGDQGDGRREQLAVNWMAQSTRAAQIHAAIAQSIYTQHHMLGVVTADTQVTLQLQNPPLGPGGNRYQWVVRDNFDRVDIDTAFSLTSRGASGADRRAAVLAIAATSDALEGHVAAQISDLPDTVSTATRFEWGNSPPSSEDFSGGYGPRRFYQFNASNAANAATLALMEGQTSTANNGVQTPQGEPEIGNSEMQLFRARLASTISTYAMAGFDVVASEESFLGPGQRGGYFSGNDAQGWTHQSTHQRGGALVATRTVSGEPVEIAHISGGFYQDAKGGGGGAQTTQQSQYDPAKAADVLRSRFVDHSSAVGVDLQNGGVTYASPAALSVGSGAFPYQLSANLIWRGGNQTDDRFGPSAHTQPQTPWTTNWNNTLTMSSSATEAFGQTDVRAATSTIAAFLAEQDIYKATTSTQRDVAAVLANAWWVRQITGNVVTATVGAETRQFDRNASGTYFAPGPGTYTTLSVTGARAAFTQPVCDETGGNTYVLTRGWDYSSMAFQVLNPNGDTQNFGFWTNLYLSGGSSCGFLHGFRLNSWTFPAGANVNLVYQAGGSGVGALDILSEVNNNLGRRIRFAYTSLLVTGFDNGLSGSDLRSVSVTRSSTDNTIVQSITDAANATTHFDTSVVGEIHHLDNVYDADDTTTPSLRYTYDALDRVMEARDAVALQGTRNPYQFFLGDHTRGERIDPAGGSYNALYDYDRRPFRFTDEIGRITGAAYDGRGRATGYTYPEGDQEQIAYDDRNDITQLTRIATPGSGLANIVVSATWNATWNKPATITDARGYRTDFAYVASGNGAGEMLSATRPAPSGATPIGTGTRPVFAFSYGTFGRVATSTDPSGVVTSNAINATTGNIDSTTLDPGTSPHLNATTSFTYDAQGDQIAATDPRSNVTESGHDAMRRPTTVLHHNGGIATALIAAERSNYDALGQVTSTEGGTAFSGTSVTTWLTRESRTYTPTGKVATVTDGLSHVTSTTYDPLDRVQNVTDPVSRVTRHEYDLAGQESREIRAYGSPLQQNYASYTYFANGERATVTDANNNLSSYVYDGFDRLSELHFPSATLGTGTSNPTDYEGYGYDANGNRTSLRVRSAESIAFAYDNLNRETLKDIPGGTAADVYSSYDLAGRRLTAHFASAGGVGVDYAYDTAGRLTTENSYSHAVGFQYDSASNRTRVTWPDTFYAAYTYDAMNRVDLVQENGSTTLADYNYDALGRRATITRGDGTVTTYTFDNASRLTQLQQNLPSTANDQTLGFSFTNANQISQRTASNDNFAWTGPVTSINYSRNGLNQYSAVASTSYSYDARGNLLADGARAFTYDLENRLLTVGGSGVVFPGSINYDPLGRMHQFFIFTTGTTELFDGDKMIADYNGNGATLLRRFVFGPGVDEPLVWYEGSGTTDRRYLIADNQGSIIAEDGASVTVNKYGPYGEPSAWAGGRFRYTGQTTLAAWGLYNYKARVYDPALGRFLQTDPVGYGAGPNDYAYVWNDPLNAVDPEGQDPCVSVPIASARPSFILADAPCPLPAPKPAPRSPSPESSPSPAPPAPEPTPPPPDPMPSGKSDPGFLRLPPVVGIMGGAVFFWFQFPGQTASDDTCVENPVCQPTYAGPRPRPERPGYIPEHEWLSDRECNKQWTEGIARCLVSPHRFERENPVECAAGYVAWQCGGNDYDAPVRGPRRQ